MSIFDNIKEGQQVVIYNPYNRQELEIHAVERVTQTYIAIDGKKYRKSDGEQFGSHTFGYHIQQAFYPKYGLMTSEEALQMNQERGLEQKRLRLANRIRGVTLRRKSYETLVKVAQLLEVEIEE